jgi:hypothetical protein
VIPASKLVKINSTVTSFLLMTAFLCALSSSANAGALYKWIDEDGHIRYSDRLPPSQNKKKHHQLNSYGVILSTKEAAKTDEELAAEAEAKLLMDQEQATADREKKLQYEKDRVLLMTFSSAEELGLARQNRLEVIDSVIQLITNSVLATQKTLDILEASAAENFTAKGEEVPGGLAQKIEHFTRKLENRNKQLGLKILEKDKINQQYELDVARFRELRQAQQN